MYVAKSFDMKTGLYEIWDTVDDSVVKVNYIAVRKSLPTTIILGIQATTLTQPGLCNCFIRLQNGKRESYILDGYTIQKLSGVPRGFQTVRGYDIPEYISSIEKINELMGILKKLNNDMYPPKPVATEYGYKFYARERPENCYTEYAPNLGVYTIVKMKEDNSGYDFTRYISVDFYGLLDIIFNEGKLIEGVEFISFNHLVCNGVDEYSNTRLTALWESELGSSADAIRSRVTNGYRNVLCAGDTYSAYDFSKIASNEFILDQYELLLYRGTNIDVCDNSNFNDMIRSIDSVDLEYQEIHCNGDGTVYKFYEVGYLFEYLSKMHPDMLDVYEEMTVRKVTSGIAGSLTPYQVEPTALRSQGEPNGSNVIEFNSGIFYYPSSSNNKDETGLITPYGYIGIINRIYNAEKYSPARRAGFDFDFNYNIFEVPRYPDRVCSIATTEHKGTNGYPIYTPIGVHNIEITDKGIQINIMCVAASSTDYWAQTHVPMILPLLLSDAKFFNIGGMLATNLGAQTLILSKGVYNAQYLTVPSNVFDIASNSVMATEFDKRILELTARTKKNKPKKGL